MKLKLALILVSIILISCKNDGAKQIQEIQQPFLWEAATVYFLLTDRFNNADTSNDINFDRNQETAKLRGFKGGDIKGITQKIKAGYFNKLGVNAIWMTPIVEQIHGGTDEGTGLTYGFHGYWTKDWTAIDPNFGTKEDLKELVDEAHKKDIRILLDAVINHTGPVTDIDPVWPDDWVRTQPQCKYQNYEGTVTCTLVKNLPDIKTESNTEVELPLQLIEKWKQEGRYEAEVAELDDFFKRTGYPRAPRFYIIKWLTDYIREFGIDGYRVDTVKHTEAYVWQEFKKECDVAFSEWKLSNPNEVLDDNTFYLVGEVYNYGISTGTQFNYGDKAVNFFDNSFNSLINFEFKWDAQQKAYEEQFMKYDSLLHSQLKNFGVLNYLSSHDDGQPFDAEREKSIETANRLLLSPGTSQIYYGDETNRSLIIEGTNGDATLRSFMNWGVLESDVKTNNILHHWQKLGQFRSKHPAIGAGRHSALSENPYTFSRTYTKDDFSDKAIITLHAKKGIKTLDVSEVFEDGIMLHDFYSGKNAQVDKGKITINTDFDILLLETLNR